MKRIFAGYIAALFALAGPLRAGVEPPVPTIPPQELKDNFASGAREFESLSGAFFFFDTTKNNRPSIDFALQSFRLGVMLNDPWEVGLLSGNFELMGEAFGGGIFEGPGNVLLGATLVFRYNFVHQHSRAPLIPYLQIGAGGVYTDIDEKESRGLISLPVEFNLQAAIGTRVMLNDRWSLIVEGDYRHISNAEIKKPNFGIDSVGGNLGFGFSF
jgi:opacity protein-like surface antigen